MKKRIPKGKFVKVDTDLDNELDHFDIESSDDGLDGEDRILLENARGRRRLVEEEEVLPIHEASSSDSEDYVDENDEGEEEVNDEESVEDADVDGESDSSEMEMDSDLDEKSDGLPDSKAWGSRRKNYYNTDYVDTDYTGFDNEEAAIMEEQEAQSIQQRFLDNLQGVDFTMGLLDKVEEKKKEALTKNVILEIEKKIEVDRSKLSETELKEFDEKETPGFNKMLDDLRKHVEYERDVIDPILEFAETSKIKDCSALQFLKKKQALIKWYSLHFLLLLRLKEHRTPNVDRHPVIVSLQTFFNELKEMDYREVNSGLKSQLLETLEIFEQQKEGDCKKRIKIIGSDEEKIVVTGKNRKERRKKLLQLINERNKMQNPWENKERKIKFADEIEEMPLEVYAKEIENENGGISEDEDNDQLEENEKRAVTYQMLKNKGLTPKRKKEMRNPRVRNKNKFKKALVRRKGQVKIARKEVKKYDGEIAGIKKNLSRSVKLK